MSEHDNAPETGHEYDGITEYDNPLPTWWLITFFATIIFGYIYWLHYESGAGQTQTAELKEDLQRLEELRKAAAPRSGDLEAVLAKLSQNPDTAKNGQAVFTAKCAVCHGGELQGVIGPNLVDDYWLHGKGQLSDIAGTIAKGVPEKGMPPWESQLKEEELQSVAVFIWSEHGKTPANAKAPQGEKFVR